MKESANSIEDSYVGTRPLKVFISHKWEDEVHGRWLDKFATDLRKANIEAILDKWIVRLGDSFTDYMTSKINEADVVLFIMTPASVAAVEAPKGEGGAVKFEMQMATARRAAGECMRLIGIYRAGDKTPAHLRDHRYADFRDDSKYAENLKKLVDDLMCRTPIPPVVSGELARIQQDIEELQKRAGIALTDTINFLNELAAESISLSDAQTKAQEFFKSYRFRGDSQFTVIDSKRYIIFHDDEAVTDHYYSEFLPAFNRILEELVTGNEKGVIRWIDSLSSDYHFIDETLNIPHPSGSAWKIEDADRIRLNTAPFSYFEPWDWYILVEAHKELSGLQISGAESLIADFRQQGWLVVEPPYTISKWGSD